MSLPLGNQEKYTAGTTHVVIGGYQLMTATLNCLPTLSGNLIGGCGAGHTKIAGFLQHVIVDSNRALLQFLPASLVEAAVRTEPKGDPLLWLLRRRGRY